MLNTAVIRDLLSTTYVPEDPSFTFGHDILTISCCKYRLDMLPKAISRSLHDPYYSDKIEPCDIEMSKDIRSYYGKKLMLSVLVEEELSPFRKALANLLNKDGKNIFSSEIGISCKLPEFYMYDLEIDKLVKDSTELTNETKARVDTRTLIPKSRLIRKTKNNHKIDYWFTDSKKELYLIKVEGNNSLDGLFKKIVDNNTEMRFNAYYSPRIKGKLTFYDVSRWDLLFD